MTRFFFLSLLLSACCLFTAFVPADPELDERNWPSIFDRLSADAELLDVELTVDLDDLAANRNVDDYREGLFQWGEGAENALPVRVKPRGKYRRKVCDFPPLKLQFPKKELRKRHLNKHNDLKLVTHCMDARSSRHTVLREYLAYELYRELTDAAFRVQLVKITYRDAHNPRRTLKRYGILIEDTDEMAERLGGKTVKKIDCRPEETVRAQEDLMTVFQSMIGNHDYDFVTGRNLKLVEVAGKRHLVPVPYDFDFSGLVNAPYAITDPNHAGLVHVTDRKYVGRAQELADLDEAVRYVVDKRKVLVRRVKDCKAMTPAERAICIAYLNGFFREAAADQLAAGAVIRL